MLQYLRRVALSGPLKRVAESRESSNVLCPWALRTSLAFKPVDLELSTDPSTVRKLAYLAGKRPSH